MSPSISATAVIPRITPDNVLIFDLDNTLYPSACDLFSQVSNLIGQYVRDTLRLPADEAYVIQKSYFHRYGTTLRGLMTEHDIDPADYLNKVHNIDLSVMDPAPELAAALNAHLAPMRARRTELLAKPDTLRDILYDGSRKARAIAQETMERVREAARLTY